MLISRNFCQSSAYCIGRSNIEDYRNVFTEIFLNFDENPRLLIQTEALYNFLNLLRGVTQTHHRSSRKKICQELEKEETFECVTL